MNIILVKFLARNYRRVPGQEVPLVPELVQTSSLMLNILFSPRENAKIQVGVGGVERDGGWGA